MSIWKAIIAAWSSRKLWMFLLTVAVLWGGLERVINHLYSLPTDKCGFLVNVAIAVFGILGCAAGAYMGFSTRFSADSVSQAISDAKTISEKITENRFEKLTQEYAEKYKDDPSYRPIEKEDFR